MVVTAVPDDRAGGWAEMEVERRRRRAQARRARQGTAFDGLAIGAPLSAAFIGMLFADGQLAANAGPGQAGDVVGARGGAGRSEPGNANAATAGADVRADGGASAAAAGGSEAGGAGFSPTIAGSSSEAARAAVDGEVAIPGEASTGTGTGADVSAGPQLSLTIGGGFGLLGSGLPDGDAAGSSGPNPIGKHVVGTDGDDVIHGTEHDDHLYGGAGDDTIYGYGGDDLLDGGPGNDYLEGGSGDDRLMGGLGHDALHGGEGNDVLDGGAGDDRLFGNEGRDILLGRSGNDHLDGGPGADRTEGGAGSDTHVIDNPHDVAGEGRYQVADSEDTLNDTLHVSSGFDAGLKSEFGEDAATFVLDHDLDAPLPADTASHRQQVDPDMEHVVLDGSAEHDVVGDEGGNEVAGNDGDNAIYGMSGDDILSGGAGRDRLDGGSGTDQLRGDAGDDILDGGAGDDDVYGGSGDDDLTGGAGTDRLFGEAGNDTFHVGLNEEDGGWGREDTIDDHEGVNGVVNGQGSAVETHVVGDDLYVLVDDNPVAIVEDWRGNEEALSGIDSGSGSVAISDLMAENGDNGPAVTEPAPEDAAPTQAWAGDDVLGAFLSGPSLTGSGASDTLTGTSGSDWLSGLEGDDHLQGGAGHDVLEGGGGENLLEGGAGDDRYLIESDAIDGVSTVRDVEGSNTIQLDGFGSVFAVVDGQNARVLADGLEVARIEGYVGNEASFAGIQNGETFIAADELFA